MPVTLRPPGVCIYTRLERSSQPRQTFYLDRADRLEEARHAYKLSPYYRVCLLSSMMAKEHKRRQAGPGCLWGHQTAFCFRESGLQFTVKQLRESSNHSSPALPGQCPCCVLLRESIC